MKQDERQKIVAIILAAGASRRLGEPKQLVSYKGKSLIRHTVDNCLEARFMNALVVLGSNAPEILVSIKDLPMEHAVNPEWEGGMASSLAFGVMEVLKRWPETKAVMISTCDQPFITSQHLSQIKEEIICGEFNIITSGYNGTYGPPVVFEKKFFNELMDLKGEKGAKSVVKHHMSEMKVLPCKEGETDIDTPEDLLGLE